MTEERLEAIAKRLGDEAAERIDVEETARAVVSRLRAEDRPRVWIPRFLQVAAVAVLAVGVAWAGWVGLFSVRDSAPAEFALAVPVVLAELNQGELTEIDDSLDTSGPIDESLEAGLSDLTESELNELLRLMEG